MDMWEPYIQSTVEHRQLIQTGDDSLKGTSYLLLKQPDNIDDEKWRNFQSLRESNLKTARAWAIKETAMEQWDSCSRAEAMEQWKRWYAWAIRSRLEPESLAKKPIKIRAALR